LLIASRIRWVSTVPGSARATAYPPDKIPPMVKPAHWVIHRITAAAWAILGEVQSLGFVTSIAP
jgi:hypothetical protein